MKVLYRIDNFEQKRGIWRDWDGNWNPVFDEFLQDGVSKDLPMEDNKIYNGGWFAATESLETLIPHWVSFDDLRKLYEHGWAVTINVCEEKYTRKLNDYETIFLKEKAILYLNRKFSSFDGVMAMLNEKKNKKTFTEKFYDITPRDVYIIEQLLKENQQQ